MIVIVQMDLHVAITQNFRHASGEDATQPGEKDTQHARLRVGFFHSRHFLAVLFYFLNF